MSKTEKTLAQLRKFESRNITYLAEDGSWPVVWKKARGNRVWDLEGREYIDLTAAFGVAAAGHANPAVVAAGQKQMSRLLHAMGDVHPHALKGKLCAELSRWTFDRWSSGRQTGKTILTNSGFEAVEAALKTAMLATGKPGVIGFAGGYHGLGYGTLNLVDRGHFSGPFRAQLGGFGRIVPYPSDADGMERTRRAIERAFQKNDVGAVLVEPVQARGGIHVPPFQFLALLRRLCDRHDALLICDEIYTGFGRTGKWFACEHGHVVPDLICLGKALAGGFPISACVGKARVMDGAWPASAGEAIHTSTFLGHPVGCAMALAQIREIQREELPKRSARLGAELKESLERLVSPLPSLRISVRSLGLMAGIELRWRNGLPATDLAMRVIKQMLLSGFILLPEGPDGNVVSLTPPLTIKASELRLAVLALSEAIETTVRQ